MQAVKQLWVSPGQPPRSLGDCAKRSEQRPSYNSRFYRFQIIARIDDAIVRGRLYGNSGEDVIFVESSRTVEDMKRSATSFNKPTMANMVEVGKTPLIGQQELQDVAYKLLAYPQMFLMASIKATKQVTAFWRDNGSMKHLVG